ncbi:hypothetical protein [endosymbiont GvMRE of Glomus versiforme]|uniref:hypothetical protein n=1 Tax=endosymbiont GvMRE of Glomus versiforme TaxID=2039283 RepID=UPI000ED4CD99|nr:hypothetical protein [endosymbiont GvMRE of Glomus versiforme]RHZ35594.1 hypothetical protein GvMRE_IIg520 [endosymbiont GvMRE of Glomus versiforme]
MTNSKYIIPKENIPKTEEITYLDQNYQPQSYEEFMKTYEPNEETDIITEAEWQDRLLHGSQYGPGNKQSKQTAASAGIGAGLVITTAICPPLGGAMSTACTATGLGIKVVGEISENEDLAKVGEVIGMAGSVGSMGGSFIGSSGHACAGCKTPSGKEIWKIRK